MQQFTVKILCLTILVFLIFGNLNAQDRGQKEVVIPKIKGEINLDGKIIEEAWHQAKKFQLVQNQPDYGRPPSEKTEVFIGYSDDYLFAACKCYDSKKPTIASFKRDYVGGDTDWFEIILDTFNDNENVILFAVTPTGSRTDAAVYNDATGDSPLDAGWSTYWDVEVLQNEEGWFVEMRIPISSLRFQHREGNVVMGLTLMRIYTRNNEFATYPPIKPKWPLSILKASQARDVILNDLKPQKPFRISPYLLGGVDQKHRLDAAGTTYQRETDPIYDLGLDAKYGLTSNLTLDLTVNTDFAQVEADNQQVNVSRFPLFFPEKRTFFLERSSNFAFNFGGPNRLFYSRRIGLQDGRQVRILGGTRLVGRSGPWDIGILNMQTARNSDLALASENFGVARLRRQIINPNSYAGGIFTSRLGMDGTYNMAFGLDGIFKVTGDNYLSLKWAQTFDHAATSSSLLETARIQTIWERRSLRGFTYRFRFDRAGTLYQPAMGFEQRDDYFHFGDRVGYGWIPGEASFLQRHSITLNADAYFRNSDRSLETLQLIPEWDFVTNSGHNLNLGWFIAEEDIRQSFDLSEEVTVPADRHTYNHAIVSYTMPGSWPVRMKSVARIGGLYSGIGYSMALSPTWNASRHLRLTGTYERIRVDFPGPGRLFESDIARLRIEVTPNAKYSLQTFVQYGSLSDNMAANIRFRYNPREGTDLYLVYNEAVNTDRYAYSPVRPISQARTLMVKYTYTFNFK